MHGARNGKTITVFGEVVRDVSSLRSRDNGPTSNFVSVSGVVSPGL